MRDLIILAVPILVLSLLHCLWRAQHLLRRWQPAAATLWKSDYSDTERADDANFQAMLGLPLLRIDPIGRLVVDDVAFTDSNGMSRRVAVRHRVPRGSERDGIYTIWYDPTAPQACVTTSGPWRWLKRACTCAFALFAIFQWGPTLLGS